MSRTDWFREARFGLFIHWGLYAIPAAGVSADTDAGSPVPSASDSALMAPKIGCKTEFVNMFLRPHVAKK